MVSISGGSLYHMLNRILFRVFFSCSNSRRQAKVSLDVIQEYAYGRSDNCVEEQDFGPSYHEAAIAVGKMGSIMKHMIWIYRLIQSLPQWLTIRISPNLGLVIGLQRVGHHEVLQAHHSNPTVESQKSSGSGYGRTTGHLPKPFTSNPVP